MSDQSVIGKIQAQAGTVSVTDTEGTVREVQAGDTLYAGDTVRTGASSTVVIEFADGSRKGMASESSVTLDDSHTIQPVDPAEQPVMETAESTDSAPAAPALGAEVGTIASVSGTVIAVAPNGVPRPLSAGEPLFAGETLETGDMSLVIIEMADGSRRGLSSNASLTLDAIAVAAPVLAAAGAAEAVADAEVAEQPAAAPEGAVAEVVALSADTTIAELQEAIEDGEDPTVGAEATAAGEEANDGGQSAVFLARSSQTTTADSGFDSNATGPFTFTFLEDPEEFEALVSALSAPDVAGPIRQIVDLIKDIIDNILDSVEDLVDDITDFLDDITDAIDQFLDNPDISDLLNNIVEAIQDLGNDVIDNVQDLVGDLIGNVGDALDVTVDTLVELLDRVQELTGIDLIETLGPIGDVISQVIEGVRGATDTVSSTLTDLGSQVNGLVDGVQGDGSLPTGVNPLIDTVQEIATVDGDGDTYNDNQPNPDATPGDSGLVDVVEDRLDPIALQDVKDAVAAQTGESGYDLGDRLVNGERSVTGAVDNVVPNARELIVDESYNVVEEVADTGDQAVFGDGNAEELPADIQAALAGEQVTVEALEMPVNIEKFLSRTTADVLNVAESGEESLTGGYDGDTSEAGAQDPISAALDGLVADVQADGTSFAEMQALADSGAQPVSQSFSQALGPQSVIESIDTNLFNDGVATIVMTPADALNGVFELHDTEASLIQIEGFSGDSTLDISDLLRNQQFDASQDDVSHFLRVSSDDEGNAVLNIGSDESGSFETAQQIVLSGVEQSDALLSQLTLGSDPGNLLQQSESFENVA